MRAKHAAGQSLDPAATTNLSVLAPIDLSSTTFTDRRIWNVLTICFEMFNQ
jgi:hypothetical protein